MTRMHDRNRPEPGLGRLDDIELQPDRRHNQAPPSARASARSRTRARDGSSVRIGLWVLIIAIVAGAVAIYVMRDALRLNFPGSETRELLNAAARAESDGQWRGAADGRDALSLYRRILEADPDNDVARLGLRRVGAQLALDAEAAIDAGDFDAAATMIDELAVIGESGDRVTALRQRLSTQRTSGSAMATLLADAQAALARKRIRGDNGALARFKAMLAKDPGNAVAQRGIDDALQVLIEEAGKELSAGRIDSARAMAGTIGAERPQHAGLPPLLQSIAEAERVAQAGTVQAETDARAAAEKTAAEARARSERDVLAMLTRGDEALRAGEIADAVAAYRRVLAASPGHAEALDGLDIASRAAVERSRTALAASDPTRATEAIALARRANADPDTLARLDGQLADLNEHLTAVLAQPELDPQQQAQLAELMDRARAAEARGDLVEPAGDSAYDLYRRALSMDPLRDDARTAVAALPRRAQTLVVHHAELGQLDQAASAIDALQAMAPLDPSLPELRRQIASAWLERGTEAMRSGAIGDARNALEKARTLSPNHPGITALARDLAGG
jgi:serine/threonine-protein kinase PpkA